MCVWQFWTFCWQAKKCFTKSRSDVDIAISTPKILIIKLKLKNTTSVINTLNKSSTADVLFCMLNLVWTEIRLNVPPQSRGPPILPQIKSLIKIDMMISGSKTSSTGEVKWMIQFVAGLYNNTASPAARPGCPAITHSDSLGFKGSV